MEEEIIWVNAKVNKALDISKHISMVGNECLILPVSHFE